MEQFEAHFPYGVPALVMGHNIIDAIFYINPENKTIIVHPINVHGTKLDSAYVRMNEMVAIGDNRYEISINTGDAHSETFYSKITFTISNDDANINMIIQFDATHDLKGIIYRRIKALNIVLMPIKR
jgi:hypothetical protein